MLEMLSAADPPFLYAVAGVVVLAIASLFGLVLFASREETFEDVVEKQRKAQEALLHSLQQGTGKSGKQNKKWNKLKNKKTSKPKASEDHEQDSGVDDDEISTETVTINTPPPTIAVEEPAPAPTTSKKKKKNKKNKQQEVVEEVKEEEVVEEEVVIEEEIVVESVPEVEAAPSEVSEEEPEPEPIVEEEIIVEEAPEVAEEPEPEPEPVPEPEPEPEPVKVEPVVKAPKKKKAPKPKAASAPMTGNFGKVTKDIQELHMQAEEVQKLMDILVEKQNELDQWKNPHQKINPMEQMKKRIAELEAQFAEERQSSQAISAKLKEAKVELQHELKAQQGIRNEAQNRINQTAQEAEAIRKRLEEKHVSDMHSAQSQISRMQQIIDDGATSHMEVQRLKEENANMRNASMMAQQLAEDKQSLMGEISQLQQTNRALRQEFDNVIIQHQQEMQNIQIAKVDSEGALSQRLQEMNDQLLKSEAHNRNLQLEIAEQQRLAEQARTESENLQMASKPDESESLALKESLVAAEAQLAELAQKCKDYETQLTAPAPVVEAEPEVEVVSSATELQELAAKCAEKDQLILQLEAKVSDLSANQPSSGQQSPDLVVVNPGDLLGSEPLLTSESFEEVNPDKDYEGEVVEQVVVPETAAEQQSTPTETLEAEIEKLKSDAETAQATITSHEAAVAQKQSEIDELQAKILALETATPSPVEVPATPAVDVEALQTQITQLQETITAKDAEIAAAKESTPAPVEEEGPTKEELKAELETMKEELKAKDDLKLKNNNASQDEILKSQQENVQLKEENAHIKNVLIETESMLCRLQTGVDAEVQKWQAKVTEKDAELEASKKSTDELKTALSKHGYDHTNLTTLESSLSDGQKQLMAEKEENQKIKTELSEMEKSLTALQQKTKELEENAAKTTTSDEVTELSSKLKKTISERDLLIREYKNVKDSNTKMEGELKEKIQTLTEKEKEIEQLKTAATTTTEPAVNGDKEVIQNEM